MYKASMENAGKSPKQNDFPIEMILLANHEQERLTPVSFSKVLSNRSGAYVKKKIMRKEKYNCASQAKVHFLYSMESSSIGVHL